MEDTTTPALPEGAAAPPTSGVPAVSAALGFGVGVNAAVGSVVVSVLAVSSTDAIQSLTSASLRPASDAGLGVAIGLAIALVSVLAAVAGYCLAAGRRPQPGAACRMALPGAAGAALGLAAGAWLLSRFLGVAEGGAPHALGLSGWWAASIVGAALVAGAGCRGVAAAAGALQGSVAEALHRAASPRMRTAAVAAVSVTLLAVCGLAFGRGDGQAPGASRSVVRPAGCPGGRVAAPRGDCAGRPGDCRPAAVRRRDAPTS